MPVPPQFADLDAAFIDQHWGYGAQVPARVAGALVLAIREADDVEDRHACFLRLFCEFAASIEAFAAYAWALREREGEGLFRAYETYRISHVGDFYADVAGHDGDVLSLLRLPPAAAVAANEQLVARLGIDGVDYEAACEPHLRHLREAGEMYRATDRLLFDVYNKAKHGALILRISHPDDDSRFDVICPHDGGYRHALFTIDDDEIEKYQSNTHTLAHYTADLASLAKLLSDAGLLYSR